MSADGRFLGFESGQDTIVPGDTNGQIDIFVRDRVAGTIERANVSSEGNQANAFSGKAVISGDGRWIAFSSDATNLVSGDMNGFFDVFLHDRVSGTTTLVSVDSSGAQGNRNSYFPSISSDGRHVAFMGLATDLVPGDTNGSFDVFVRDFSAAATRLHGKSATNEKQAEFALQMVRRPHVDPQRFGFVWDETLALMGTYELAP